MSVYRTIDACFWSDSKVKKLDTSGRLLLLYLITNPHSHVSGIYLLPWLYIHHESGIPLPRLDTLSDTLSRLEIAHFDRRNDVIFVINMLSYQGRGEKNLRSAANQLGSLHKSPLIIEFLEKYPAARQYISHTLSDTLSIGLPDLALRSDQDQDQDQDQDASQSSAREKAAPKYSQEFESFWENSTHRGSKLAAWKAWSSLRPDSSLQMKIRDCHDSWKESEQWQDETKQPHISTWLNRRGWEEIVPRSLLQPRNGNGDHKPTQAEMDEAYARLKAQGGIK